MNEKKGGKEMIVVGQVSTREEADEIALIGRIIVVGNRARYLANKNRKK